MSYSVLLFNPIVKSLAANGEGFDEIELPPIAPEAVAAFLTRLGRYGYAPSGESAHVRAFTKKIGTSEIHVLVASSEISFSVAAMSSDAVFEVLQDASELTDRGDLALFNPQEGGWLEA